MGIPVSGKTIFVFGSNRQGIHGAGAAKAAVERHGAKRGQAAGLQGQSYAIITKELRPDHPPVTLEEINEQVWTFAMFVAAHPNWTFNVTRIGCGLAGFKDADIAPMFAGAPDNVKLPEGWRDMK